MKTILRHVTRCAIAGIVALLPLGGFVLTVVYLETGIANSWLAKQAFYFPGLGMLAAAMLIYLIGLFISTVLGRWIWKLADRMLDRLPLLGSLYQTLKQIVGYGEGKDAIFQQVVLVPTLDDRASEIGLVTNRLAGQKCVVFIPNAPNLTIGRMLIVEAAQLQVLDLPVTDALKSLVSVGKTLEVANLEVRR